MRDVTVLLIEMNHKQVGDKTSEKEQKYPREHYCNLVQVSLYYFGSQNSVMSSYIRRKRKEQQKRANIDHSGGKCGERPQFYIV